MTQNGWSQSVNYLDKLTIRQNTLPQSPPCYSKDRFMFAIKASKYKISFYSMEVSLYDDEIAIFPYNAQLIILKTFIQTMITILM